MAKDFNSWNSMKQKIDVAAQNKFYHERDVWWCSLGVNIGFEQDGTGHLNDRPVLVLKSLGKNMCFVVPLTSSLRKHSLRIPIGIIQGREASAIVSQMRVVDTRRLTYKVKRIEVSMFEVVRKAVRDLL